MTDPKALVEARLGHDNWGVLGQQGYALGLDIGGYGVRAALVDLHAGRYVSLHRDTSERSPRLVDEAIALGQALLASQPGAAERLVRVGAGFGGPIDTARGEVVLAPRTPGWERFPLRERLEQAFGAAIIVDNDANLIALAEALFGAGHDIRHLFYLHLSTGVGGGLVLNGHLYRGANTTAGEIGHAAIATVGAAGEPATLEHVLSIGGLLRRAAALGLTTDRLDVIFGDHPAAQRVVAEATEQLALTLAQITALLDPQRIVVGGVVARSGGAAFLDAVRRRVPTYAGHAVIGHATPIVASELGFDSVAIGGLAAALQSLSE
ncbi:MAG: ROK family protein [Chloroflexi bacterium]|nr:ROK family protein [Chloroflexota bacterium]